MNLGQVLQPQRPHVVGRQVTLWRTYKQFCFNAKFHGCSGCFCNWVLGFRCH